MTSGDRATRGLDKVIPKMTRSARAEYCAAARMGLREMARDIDNANRRNAFGGVRDLANEADIIQKSLKHCNGGRKGGNKRRGRSH